MRILSVGTMNGLSNTCLHRHWALKEMADEIDVVNTSQPSSLWYKVANRLFLYGLPLHLPDNAGANKTIVEYISSRKYDIIWIDKGILIHAKTLETVRERQPHAKIISYSPDNMALRHNQSQQYLESIPLYDLIVTNKSYILEDMKKLGAKRVLFVNNTFEPTFHHPRQLTDAERLNLGGDVGFIGMWEKERCDSICYLADHGVKVTVWGGGQWNRYKDYSPNLTIKGKGLFSDDYCKALQAFKINLCFLRKMNFDRQTTRSVEIPACGGFMLAERTNEHLAMFEENKEAAYFSSNEELLEKCRYYLAHKNEREAIRIAGTNRCKISDYSNKGMVARILKEV